MRAYKCGRCGEEVKTKMAMGKKRTMLKCRNNHIFFANRDTPFELKKISPSAINCPHTDKLSKGFGMCGTCYAKYRGKDPAYREKRRVCQKKYMESHPDRFFFSRSKYNAKKLSLGAKKKLLNWLFALIEEEKSGER